jgi:hypothetical protein
MEFIQSIRMTVQIQLTITLRQQTFKLQLYKVTAKIDHFFIICTTRERSSVSGEAGKKMY